ncbi:MAG: hypothetical protein Q9226_005468 [Calogaya cf. arnoldii]
MLLRLCAGRNIIAPPKAISWGKSPLDIFGIFADRTLVHCYWDGKSWNGWNRLGGVCLQTDATVTRTVNRIDVFYRGVDNVSYHKWYDGQTWYPSTDGAESLGTPTDESMSHLIPVTDTSTTDPKDHVQVRMEINDLHAHHQEQFELYIRAMSNLMARPETHSLSCTSNVNNAQSLEGIHDNLHTCDVFREERRRRVAKICVIDLLGPQTQAVAYPPVPKEAVEKVSKMCELANDAKEGTHYMEGAFQIVPRRYPTFDLNAVHRREWLANLRIESFAVDGSFFIHYFLGDFSSNPANWTHESNLVATHSVFSPAVVKDRVPEVHAGQRRRRYCQRRRVLDQCIAAESEGLSSLAVTVAATIVEFPDEPGELPKWGVPEIFKDIIEEKAGGYDENATI